MFKENAARPQVKMIEIKLSQGAKPSHGGVLPKVIMLCADVDLMEGQSSRPSTTSHLQAKITPQIAEARGIPYPPTSDCNSPPNHSEFSTPEGLIDFISRLRDLSGGKPVGFKLCVGQPEEFMALVHAMRKGDVYPDFITIDGAEGGTGAAPPEFSNSIGTPLIEGLTFANNVLRGAGIREHIKIICSGKVLTGFSIVERLALGADLCNSARAMMYAIGCIQVRRCRGPNTGLHCALTSRQTFQALKCNTNQCPTGVATQDRVLMEGLVVEDKSNRVANYHGRTVKSACEILGALGCADASEIRPTRIVKRVSETEVKSMAELYPLVEYGAFVDGTAPKIYQAMWDRTEARTAVGSAHVATRREIIERRKTVGLSVY